MKAFTRVCLSIALISIGLGMGVLFVAAGRRTTLRDTPAYSAADSAENVKGLDIRMDVGELTIIQGDEFRVEAENLYNEDDFSSYMSGDVWIVSNKLHNISDTFSLFGFNIPISIGMGRFKAPKIAITVPRGFHADDIKISIGAGKIKADNLSADTASFSVDAGSLEIDGLVISEKSSYFVSAGQIKLEEVDIRNITVECNVGSVWMEGIVTGDNDVYCDVGKVTLKLEDSMDFYSFDIDSDIGNVIINNKSYHNKNIRRNGNISKGSFGLKVDVGNISMDFRK